MKKKVLFLDRDGVINIDYGYVHTIDKFVFTPHIFDICRLFQKNGYEIIVITNQSGIGRGIFSEQQFLELNKYMLSKFEEAGILILDVLYCPDFDNKSDRRKPNPGMFLEAIQKYNVDVEQSLNIGDKNRDLIAGYCAGIMNNIRYDVFIKINQIGICA